METSILLSFCRVRFFFVERSATFCAMLLVLLFGGLRKISLRVYLFFLVLASHPEGMFRWNPLYHSLCVWLAQFWLTSTKKNCSYNKTFLFPVNSNISKTIFSRKSNASKLLFFNKQTQKKKPNNKHQTLVALLFLRHVFALRYSSESLSWTRLWL